MSQLTLLDLVEGLIAAVLLYGVIWLSRNWKRRTNRKSLRVLAYVLLFFAVGVYLYNGFQDNYLVLSLAVAAVVIDCDLIGAFVDWRRGGKAVNHSEKV